MTASSRLEEVRRRLALAQSDLRLAEVIVSQGVSYPHQACFHAQQAAEKTLKAALIFDGIAPGRLHELDHLRDRLPAAWAIKQEQPSLLRLSDWSVRARYPGDWPEATEQDAEQAVRQARAVWDSIAADLLRRGFDVLREL